MINALKIALNAADSKKASDIVAMDITEIATFTNYFLICTGDSSRQMHAIADEVEKQLAAIGIRPSHVEGYQNAEWILMDYVDLVVHIFSKNARAYYDLERLWMDGKELDTSNLIQVQGAEQSSGKRKNARTLL
jgi:ribosome-associated protein